MGFYLFWGLLEGKQGKDREGEDLKVEERVKEEESWCTRRVDVQVGM